MDLDEISDNSIEGKLVLLGASAVGKTSICARYVFGDFDTNTRSTIGASFLTKKMKVDDRKVKLQIWDTAGQERFRSMAPMYYRGAEAALCVFDLTGRDTFNAMKGWVYLCLLLLLLLFMPQLSVVLQLLTFTPRIH